MNRKKIPDDRPILPIGYTIATIASGRTIAAARTHIENLRQAHESAQIADIVERFSELLSSLAPKNEIRLIRAKCKPSRKPFSVTGTRVPLFGWPLPTEHEAKRKALNRIKVDTYRTPGFLRGRLATNNADKPDPTSTAVCKGARIPGNLGARILDATHAGLHDTDCLTDWSDARQKFAKPANTDTSGITITKCAPGDAGNITRWNPRADMHSLGIAMPSTR